jgi:uncharacterized protein YbbC (DUF1343 family)
MFTNIAKEIQMMEIRTIGRETFFPSTSFFRILRAMKYSKLNMPILYVQKYINLFSVACFWILLSLIVFSRNLGYSQLNSNPFKEYTHKKKKLMLGSERFDLYIDSLINKRVAIVGNQTSVIGNTHLVDTLLSLGITIDRVFSPEHGFRGNADNGEKVDNEHDVKTGLEIVSLYGNNRKPSKAQLENIDLILFDIQDVGTRFYTYISSLHLIMEACAEKGISMIVLDRPNPNAHYIDGPVLEPQHKSFIGMHPVPIVYGMTIGEYARMINNEYWLKDSMKCNLYVVPCKYYSHKMPYTIRIPPSPNLRSQLAVCFYPTLCLFEGTTVSIGRGTDMPFEVYGHPKFPESDFQFTPKPGVGSKKPPNEGKLCYGVDLKLLGLPELTQLNLDWIIEAKSLLGDSNVFFDQPSFFDRLAGTSKLREQIMNKTPEEEIRLSWEEGIEKFKRIRRKHLLYD